MILFSIFLIGTFIFFGWLITNSREARTGDTKRTKKQLKWIFSISAVFILFAIIIGPILEQNHNEQVQGIKSRLLQDYGSQIKSIEFVYPVSKTRSAITKDGIASPIGNFRFEVIDKKGNRWDWDVKWKEENGEFLILDILKR